MLHTRVPLVFTHFRSTRLRRLARGRLHMLAISFNYESHRLCVIRTLMCVGAEGRHRHENRETQVKMSSFKEATIVPTRQDVWMQDHRGSTLALSPLDWCLASVPRTSTPSPSRCSLLSDFVAVMKGRRLFHSNNDSALTSEPNFNVARQPERHRHPDVVFLLFSFCFNCSLDSVAFFSCYECVKLKKGKFAKIKGRKLRNG